MKIKVKIENVSVNKTTHNHGLDEKDVYNDFDDLFWLIMDVENHYLRLSSVSKDEGDYSSFVINRQFALSIHAIRDKVKEFLNKYKDNDLPF